MEMSLCPYFSGGTWVFDDPATGLKAEAFVLGIPAMIDRILALKQVPAARQGFAMTFAAEPFPGYDVELHWQRPDVNSGTWYAGDVAGLRMEDWLCEALFKYFPDAPPRIFVRFDLLPVGVNPVWDNRLGEGIRFVGPDDYGR